MSVCSWAHGKTAAILLCAAGLFLASSCERYPTGGDVRFRRDMVDQVSYRPQEDPRPLPEASVPVDGLEPETTDNTPNPVPATPASLELGRKYYAIACLPCHGETGHGDGPVGQKMPQPADLTRDDYIRYTDGRIYKVVRYGGAIMPPQAEVLAPLERWHAINYVRKLQRP